MNADMSSDEAGPQAVRSRRIESQGYLHDSRFSTANEVPTATSKQPPVVSAASPNTLSHGQCPPSAPCSLQIASLMDEKAFLTKYVERLLTQMRKMLHKYGELDRLKQLTDPQVTVDEHGHTTVAMEADTTDPLAPWLTSEEFVNPLFQSYDLKIHELERAVEESKQAMDQVAARAESLAKENTSLRQDLEAAGEKLMLRLQHEPGNMSLRNDDLLLLEENDEYSNEINERVDLLMSENNMLMEQVSLQDDELSAMKKEITSRDQQLQIMEQNFNDATLTLQELRDSYAVSQDEKRHCEQQVHQYAVRMAQLESQNEARSKQIETMHADRRKLENQLVEYEGLLHTVKQNAERKEETFSVRYQNVCARLRELSNIIDAKEKVVDELEEKNRVLSSDLESVRQDCEGMLRVMNSMEKQLTQYCNREDAVAELEQECKAKVEETILEKEQIAAREVQARREIARLLERLQQQASEYIKEQEENMSMITRRHEAEMSSREEEIQSLNAELTQIRTKLKKVKQLADRAAAAEEAKDMANHLEAEYQQKLRSKEEELMKLRADFRERGQELNEKVACLERELEMRRTEAREVKEETEEKGRKIQLLNDQLNKVKTDCANRFTTEFEALHQQNRDLKAQVAEMEYKYTQAKKDAVTGIESAKNERERAEVRLLAEVESLKTRVTSLKEDRNRVEKGRQEAESKCSVLSMKVQQLSRDLNDLKEMLVEREHMCDDSDRKISELSAQLTIALSKQQQLYRQERDMKTSMERLAIEKTRMKREAKMTRKKLEEYRAGSYTFIQHPYSHGHVDNNARSIDSAAIHSRSGGGIMEPVEKTVRSDSLYQVTS